MEIVLAFIAGAAVGVGTWDQVLYRRLNKYQEKAIADQNHAIEAGREFRALSEELRKTYS